MREVVIVEYDPHWPKLFAAEAAELRLVFGVSLVGMEHIGSTAVPGLAAKPIVDIQVVVRSVSDVEDFLPDFAARGWQQGVFTADTEPHLYFKKHDAKGARTHQLHVYEPDNPAALAHRLFRDYLCGHPEEAARYLALKLILAEKFRQDVLGYAEAKTEYVLSVLAKARG